MQRSFLTVKLHELEQQQRRLWTRIRMCQKEDLKELKREIEEIQTECEAEDALLKQSVENARSRAVTALAQAQLSYDRNLEEILEKTLPESMHGKSSYTEEKAEADMLYAEYSIDFAIRASRNALKAALTAVEAELEFEEWRKIHE